MKAEEIQPYGPVREIDKDLFVVDGEWYETSFRRRMTIIRRKDGGLIIHNAVQFQEKDYSELEKLGRVDCIVVPNVLHDSDAPALKRRFPGAQVFVPLRGMKKQSARMQVTGSLERDWPYASEVAVVPFEGWLGESALIHLSSKTLILTDMSFNMKHSDFKNDLERRTAGKWNGILDQFGPSRFCRWVVAPNKDYVTTAIRKICEFSFDRIIVNHGQILATGGRKALIDGFQNRYGPMGLGILFAVGLSFSAQAAPVQPDWSENAVIPVGGRANPYGFGSADLDRAIQNGKHHALEYPVETTAALAPYGPLKKVTSGRLAGLGGIRSFDDLTAWLGLGRYPTQASQKGIATTSPYFVPVSVTAKTENLRMGVTLIQRRFSSGTAVGMTMSCASCHATELFGRPVLGLTNRFPRSNDFFRLGKVAVRATSPGLFKSVAAATPAEVDLFKELRAATLKIEAKKPQALGLDTSLAHVALSLSRRLPRPDFEALRTEVADSKPAPWFTLKYKTRWLLDGSVVSGNPILTNFIWNEIGRGSDVADISDWIDRNEVTIQEMTAAVFSTESPRFTDFFPKDQIRLDQAKAGEGIFNQACAGCHGTYVKAWNRPESPDSLETTEVLYPNRTPVRDVGTDAHRREGMKSLAARLNGLDLSKKHGIRIQPQKGYVPPPLVGIWARWPYFHNNSVPNLCALLTAAKNRPLTYWAGPANDPAKDFDKDCNGYPTGTQTPAQWKTRAEFFFDTRKTGLGNFGHDEGIVSRGGKDRFSAVEKSQLIQFLQTL